MADACFGLELTARVRASTAFQGVFVIVGAGFRGVFVIDVGAGFRVCCFGLYLDGTVLDYLLELIN